MCPDPLAGTGRAFSRFWVTKMHRSAHSRPVFFFLPILAEVVVGKPSSRSKPHNTWRGKLVSCLHSQQETWNNFFRISTITWCVRLLKVIFFQRCLSLLSENLALRDKKKKKEGTSQIIHIYDSLVGYSKEHVSIHSEMSTESRSRWAMLFLQTVI